MRYFRILFLVLTIVNTLQSSAQDLYDAGVGSVSLQPGDESIALALAGYAGPWAGRFTLKWIEKGKAAEHPAITKSTEIPEKMRKAIDLNRFSKTTLYRDTVYGLSENGVIKRAVLKGKKPTWQSYTPLAGMQDFVVHNQYLYAATGSDTLWKASQHDLSAGWQRAGYYNGQIRKVNIKKLFLREDKLFAVSDTDSLFEAGKNTGKPQEESFARALAIKKDNKTVVMLCVDLCGFGYGFGNEIKKAIALKSGLPPEAILINASHTHFVPGTQAWLTWAPHNRLPDSNYLNKVVKPAITKAAEIALDHMTPSTIYFGRGTTEIGYNRSNAGSKTPYDDAVDVIRVVSQDGKNNAMMVLSGCHPVGGTGGIGHYTLSSNYPGYMRSILEKTIDGNTKALFMQGCAGDINPRDEPDITGMKLAVDALKVLNGNLKPLTGPITFSLDTMHVETSPMSKEKTIAFREENLKSVPGMVAERNVAWADLMLQHYAKGTMPGFMPEYIQTVNIGNWKLVGLSREVVTEYSLAIKKIWPGKMVSVAGYCNDVSSYLPIERHIRTRVYEGHDSYIWYGQPSSFPLNILDRVVDRIQSKNF